MDFFNVRNRQSSPISDDDGVADISPKAYIRSYEVVVNLKDPKKPLKKIKPKQLIVKPLFSSNYFQTQYI